MNLQTIITGIIILLAAIYVGWNVWRKIKAFSPKKAASCGSNCGCDSKTKA